MFTFVNPRTLECVWCRLFLINFENFYISFEIRLFNLSIKQSAFQIFKEHVFFVKSQYFLIHFLNILFKKHLESGGANDGIEPQTS